MNIEELQKIKREEDSPLKDQFRNLLVLYQKKTVRFLNHCGKRMTTAFIKKLDIIGILIFHPATR